jgi:hypothetical protein
VKAQVHTPRELAMKTAPLMVAVVLGGVFLVLKEYRACDSSLLCE